jgi:hypothetical protein
MKLFFILTFVFLLSFGMGYAQTDTTATQPQAQEQTPQGQTIIDLTKLGKTYTISPRMELPQVKMFDRRIVPDFKEVRAEKSFSSELSSNAEEIQYEPITSGRVQPIKNVDALLKKKRF